MNGKSEYVDTFIMQYSVFPMKFTRSQAEVTGFYFVSRIFSNI